MLIVVRVGIRHRRHLDQLGAAQPQHVLLFLALGVGDDDERAIAACARHQRKPDAGIAGGRLDHKPARLEVPALLRLQDHLFGRAILHGLARVHELGFAQDGAAGRLRRAPEPEQRRVADGFNNSVADGHEYSVRLVWRANLMDSRRGDKVAATATVAWSFAQSRAGWRRSPRPAPGLPRRRPAAPRNCPCRRRRESPCRARCP